MKLLPKFILSLGVLGVALTVAISFFSYGKGKENGKGNRQDIVKIKFLSF